MCLGIPMKVVSIDREKNLAQADAHGVVRTISLAMMEGIAEGDWVMVHTGFAIERLEYEEAKEILALLEEVGRADG